MEDREMEEIRILMLEDNPDDVQLTKMILENSEIDFQMKVIHKEDELKSENLEDYHVILCDYSLPDYDGLRSLKYIREFSDIPVIVVSGSIGEELAYELLIAGADDFVNKSFLKKLPIVIHRSIANQQNKRIAGEYLRKCEETTQMFNTLFDGLENPVFLKDANRRFVRVNAGFCKLYERSELEILGKLDEEIDWMRSSARSIQDDMHILEKGLSSNYEISYISDNGKRKWLEVTKDPIFTNGQITGILGQAKDITRQKDAVQTMEKSQHVLYQAEELTESGSFEYNVELDLVTCSKNLMKMLGMHSNQISLGRLVKLVKEEDRSIFLAGINDSIIEKKEYRMQHRYAIGDKGGDFEILFRPDFKDETGNTFYGIIVDISRESSESRTRIDHQEESRNEIARELHDNLGQKLNAVSMFLGKASDCEECNEIIGKSTALIHEGIDDLGRMLTSISVKHIDDISLKYALERLTDHLPEQMNLEFNCKLNESAIDQFKKRQIFRVVQETVNNAIKYSEAENLKITLRHDGNILSMLVEDDGNGFEIHDGELGNGLMNITHRVKRSNGLINIDSKKGQGTKVMVKMPAS